MKILIAKALGARHEVRGISARPTPCAPRLQSAFTMIEIAICLAIIGIALVAIIGVLPMGLNVQKDNREETIINQDATVFIEAIRNGARGADDLTNYVYAITNYWTLFNANGSVNNSGVNGYTYTAASAYGTPVPFMELTNGANIVGLLSVPEFTTNSIGNFLPIPTLLGNNGYSNHIVASVRSISGPASEKPPQDNDTVLGGSFSYKIICENTPPAVDTNSLYNQQLTANLHELRLTFLWTSNVPHNDRRTTRSRCAQHQFIFFPVAILYKRQRAMIRKSKVQSPRSKVPSWGLKNGVPRCLSFCNSQFAIRNSAAFTLVEVMVVAAMLVLIVLALMTVFNGTQTAFRAGITQTDVLESGRAVSDLIKSDLEGMTPSYGVSNVTVNFYMNTNLGYTPLIQPLPGGTQPRSYVLENFFILTRQNRTWTGVGYVVDTSSSSPINPLYRFSMSTNVMAADPVVLFNIFTNFVATSAFTNMSHLVDGVVNLRVRAYDTNGYWMTNTTEIYGGQFVTNRNVLFSAPVLGEVGFYMYSNTVPASVEMELDVLEDRTLQRAESLPNNVPVPPPLDRRTLYLQDHAGQVHVFRQRAWIRNVDPSAYQ